jgi:arylsulfatase A-like enzyme
MNNKVLKLFLLFLISIPLSGFTQDRPNVVLIVLDDMNDYLGVLGGHPQAKTPHMDQLAQEGVLFSNAHSNAPVCAPSRASFMSGILPSTSLNYGFNKRTKNEILVNSKTLPEFAKENGYLVFQTGKIQHHVVKSDWDEMGVPKYQGPLAYNGMRAVPHPPVPKKFGEIGALDGTFAPLSDIPIIPKSKKAPGYTGWWNHKKKKPFRYISDTDRDLMTDEKSVVWFEKKIKSLEVLNTKKPFFIAFGIMNPHTPHVAPQKYFDRFPIETIEIPVIKNHDNEDCSYDDVLSGKGKSHFAALKASYKNIADGLKAYMQAYLAEVSFADDIVGHVLATIKESTFKDTTVILLVSDHGYNIGEKDYLFKNSPWEESTRIPFIIKDPRQPKNAGKIVLQPISLIDLYPTISDLCNFKGNTKKNEKGAALDGYSLVPFLEDSENTIWEGPKVALTIIKNKGSVRPEHQHYSLRSKDHRYVRYSNGSEELYDHAADPYEWTNEIDNPKYNRIKRALRFELKRQIKGILF